MASIVLSIKPEFAYKILTGEKRFEFRRRLCKRDISKIYIYATVPVKKVVAEVEVTGKIWADKESVWKNTCAFSGISKEFYENYFAGMKQAGAYCLGTVIEYECGKDIEEFGLSCVPQSFAYV